MLQYIIRRILLFIPSVFFITLTAFIINSSTPGDPVMRLLGVENDQQGSPGMYEQQYNILQHKMGLDLPVFYISFSSAADPDSLFTIKNSLHRRFVRAFSYATGNPDGAKNYYRKAISFLKKYPSTPEADKTRKYLERMDFGFIPIHKAMPQLRDTTPYGKEWLELNRTRDETYQKGSWKNRYIPVISWNGYNQYHRWLFGEKENYEGSFKGILHGNFGKSYITGKSISTVIKERAGWTLFFTLGGILISLLIAIPIGIYSAARVNSRFDKRSSKFFLLLHSLPSFFTATLLLMIFANPSILGWFPASGVGPVSESNASLMMHLPYLVLPLICYALASLPFLARTVRSSMIGELDKDYIVTARAKGLQEKDVLWRHAFRNSFFPLITLIAWLFPAMIGGSAILETVFSIPGMGLEIVQAIYNRDYPMIIAVFTLTGLLTVTGYLVSDLLYTVADPRIELK